MSISPLPKIMSAPNGARKTKQDHPAMPITVEEVVRAAADCYAAGAGGLHAHVRDQTGAHVLDAGLYRELLSEMALQTPDMMVQITTEAVGRYTPEEQRALVKDVMPTCVSIALREMTPDQDEAELRRFYHWAHEASIGVQHILYAQDDVDMLDALLAKGVIPEADLEVLFVLGRYAADQESDPAELKNLLDNRPARLRHTPWALCAFGRQETKCLTDAIGFGGKARIGFENNFYNSDGTRAADNAERVRSLVKALEG